jgi:ribosomal protein S21
MTPAGVILVHNHPEQNREIVNRAVKKYLDKNRGLVNARARERYRTDVTFRKKRLNSSKKYQLKKANKLSYPQLTIDKV